VGLVGIKKSANELHSDRERCHRHHGISVQNLANPNLLYSLQGYFKPLLQAGNGKIVRRQLLIINHRLTLG